MTHPFGLLRQRNIILQYYVEHSMFIIGQIKCSWLLPHRQAICFSSLIWLSRNKSVKKSRFSRIVKNSREFSLLDLDLEAFWFHFSLLEKEWKHFDFTLHFSKKSESFLFSLFTSRTSKTHSRWSLQWPPRLHFHNQPKSFLAAILSGFIFSIFCRHHRPHHQMHCSSTLLSIFTVYNEFSAPRLLLLCTSIVWEIW